MAGVPHRKHAGLSVTAELIAVPHGGVLLPITKNSGLPRFGETRRRPGRAPSRRAAIQPTVETWEPPGMADDARESGRSYAASW